MMKKLNFLDARGTQLRINQEGAVSRTFGHMGECKMEVNGLYRIYRHRTRLIMVTKHVPFDEIAFRMSAKNKEKGFPI